MLSSYVSPYVHLSVCLSVRHTLVLYHKKLSYRRRSVSVTILAYCCTNGANRLARGALSTDFPTTSLGDVNWTVTMINQRRLPLMLLTPLRITPTAYHHGRQPPWRKFISIRHGGPRPWRCAGGKMRGVINIELRCWSKSDDYSYGPVDINTVGSLLMTVTTSHARCVVVERYTCTKLCR